MRETIEDSDLAADVFVKIGGVEREAFGQSFPDSHTGAETAAALERLLESGITSARLHPQERRHRAEPETIAERRGRADR